MVKNVRMKSKFGFYNFLIYINNVKIKVVDKHKIKRFFQKIALKTIQISNYHNI